MDIGLAEVTPDRQVNVAEDQWVSRGFMVLDHVGIDETAAVDLIARQTHPIFLECSTVLTRLSHIQACCGFGAYCHQMGTPGHWCHSIKHGLVSVSKVP